MRAARNPADEARRGHQHGLAATEPGIGAFGIVHAGHGQRRLFRHGGTGDQLGGIGLFAVFQVQRHRLRRSSGVGEAGIRVLGDHLGHRHRALGQRRESGGIDGGGRHHRGVLAQEHAQAKVAPFGAFDLLGLAKPALHRQRRAGDQHRVRCVCPGGAGVGNEVLQQVKRVGHSGAFRCSIERDVVGRCRSGQM